MFFNPKRDFAFLELLHTFSQTLKEILYSNTLKDGRLCSAPRSVVKGNASNSAIN